MWKPRWKSLLRLNPESSTNHKTRSIYVISIFDSAVMLFVRNIIVNYNYCMNCMNCTA